MYALHLTHLEPSFLQDPPGAVGSFSAPGDQVNRPSRSRTDRRMFCFCMFFLLGFLVEETPCEHANSTQKGPGYSPPEHCALWGGPAPQSQQCPMRESNSRPSCCEAAVQAVQAVQASTEPPCHHFVNNEILLHSRHRIFFLSE